VALERAVGQKGSLCAGQNDFYWGEKMRRFVILSFVFLGMLGCKDKPYVERVEVLKKHELSGAILYPHDQSVLSSNSFRDGVSIKATVASAVPLVECHWLIQSENQGEEHVMSGQGRIDGVNCQIEEVIDGRKFRDGNYFLKVNAEDTAGLKLNEVARSFQVLKEAPDIKVISPMNNDLLSADVINISGFLNDAKDIKEIRASFHGIGIENQHLNGSAKASVNGAEWKISLGQDLIAGNYAVDLVVADFHGNERTFPRRNIRIDNQPPTILGALDGVPQSIYTQETINYRQRFLDENKNPRYVIEPIGEGSALNWQKAPAIYRWLARLDDFGTAPGYAIRASDDNKLKEVRYRIAPKCASLAESDRIAKSQNDLYDIRFTDSAAGFNLTRNSEIYCLSIWAIDQAGNTSNHRVEFIWNRPLA